jgi:hypothetical protein
VGPLDVVAQAEVRARDAAAAAEEILVELRAATARGDGNAARAFGAAYAAASDRAARAERQVLELDEQRTRISQRDGEVMAAAAVGAIETFVARHGLERGAVTELRELMQMELREPGSTRKALPSVLPQVSTAVETSVSAEVRNSQRSGYLELPAVAGELDDDDEPVGEMAVEVAGDVDDPRDDEPLVLCDPSEVPSAWRNRFELSPAGAERARVAYSEHLRELRRKREAAEAAAEEAERERAKAAAAERADRVPGPAPAGWNSRRGGRGRGPSGERAGG